MSEYVDKIQELGTKSQRYFPKRDELRAEIKRVIEERARGGFKHVSTSIESDSQHKFYGVVLTFLPWASNQVSCEGGHVEVFDTLHTVVEDLLRPPYDDDGEFNVPQIDAVLRKARNIVMRRSILTSGELGCLTKYIDTVRDELHVASTGKHLPTMANMNWVIKRAQENTSTVYVGRKFSRETEEYLVKEISRLAEEMIDWNKEDKS